MRKLALAAVTAATLALGMGAAATSANAGIYIGIGRPAGWCSWHYCGPGIGWHPRRHYTCWWKTVRRNNHWVKVRSCGWVVR